VPAKPRWYSNLDDIIRDLTALPRPFIDRATVEFLLGVGRRRAQQIMAPCLTDRIGSNGVVDRNALILHLQRLAECDGADYELQRRRKVAVFLNRERTERLTRPQLLVEAPVEVINQELAELPGGIELEQGRITIEFREPREALEKLLALAMAVGNDLEGFERKTRLPRSLGTVE
jgi:hypothetical protein